MKINRGEWVEATFTPRQTDDLREGVNRYIGQKGLFEALFVIDEGYNYAGEWAMAFPPDWDIEALWAPLGDLQIIHHGGVGRLTVREIG